MTHKMTMKILIAALALIVLVVRSAAQAAKQEPHQGSLAQQKMCADQAKKFFNDPNFKSEYYTEYTSHYDVTTNACYIMIRSDIKLKDANGNKDLKNWSVAFGVFDAFEGTNRGWLQEKVAGTFEERKPYACDVRPIGQEEMYCKTEDEFYRLIKKYFGLEKP